MAIALNAGRIEIDTGTVTLANIYDAAVAGGWTGFRRDGNYTYISEYPIRFYGDSNCYFGYSNWEALIFQYDGAHGTVYALEFASTGQCRIGRHHPTSYGSNKGMVINFMDTTQNYRRYYFLGDVEVANSQIMYAWYAYIYGNATTEAYIYKTTFSHTQFGLSTNEYTNVEDVRCFGSYYGFQPAAINNVNGLSVTDSYIGLLMSATREATFKKLVMDRIQLATRYTYLRCCNYAGDKNVYFVDCKIPKTGISFYISGAATGDLMHTQYLQTTTQIIVTDDSGNLVEGAEVKIYDKNDTLLLTENTDVNGEVNTVLTFYDAWLRTVNAALHSQGENEYAPFKISISKATYDDLSFPKIDPIEGEQTIIRATIVLAEPPVYINDNQRTGIHMDDLIISGQIQ